MFNKIHNDMAASIYVICVIYIVSRQKQGFVLSITFVINKSDAITGLIIIPF